MYVCLPLLVFLAIVPETLGGLMRAEDRLSSARGWPLL